MTFLLNYNVSFLFVADKQQELDLPTLKVEDTDAPNSTGAAPNKKKDKKTTPMSQISGVRKLKHTNSFTGMLPRYGVECANEEDLNKVRIFNTQEEIALEL